MIFLAIGLVLLTIITILMIVIVANAQNGAYVQAGAKPSGDNGTVNNGNQNNPGVNTNPGNTYPTLQSWVNAAASNVFRPTSSGSVRDFGGEIVSENAILIDMSNNTAVYERSPDAKVQVGSMTKVMTLAVVCDLIDSNNDFYQVVEMKESFYANLQGYNKVFFPGNKVYVIDLMYGLILQSGCDAALALADHFGGSEAAFVAKMNAKAAALGMASTKFTNSYGADDGGANLSSVRDIAAVFNYALENPLCKTILTAKKYVCYGGYSFRTQKNTSLVLDGFSDKDTGTVTVLGGKSGNDTMAGYSLVSFGETETGKLYLVVTARNMSKTHQQSTYDSTIIYKNYTK